MSERLRLTKPVQPLAVTQRFGDDLTCVDTATHTKCVTRVAGAVCPVGYESLYTSAGLKGHNGVDLHADNKQSVYAATNGKIYKVVSETERGIGVEIISRRRYVMDGVPRSYRVKTRYWHLDSYVVAEGQKVKAGELIGYADNTGLSSGTHLHFELKPVRRRLSGSFRNVMQGNGYFGAIDPEPYFKD